MGIAGIAVRRTVGASCVAAWVGMLGCAVADWRYAADAGALMVIFAVLASVLTTGSLLLYVIPSLFASWRDGAEYERTLIASRPAPPAADGAPNVLTFPTQRGRRSVSRVD